MKQSDSDRLFPGSLKHRGRCFLGSRKADQSLDIGKKLISNHKQTSIVRCKKDEGRRRSLED